MIALSEQLRLRRSQLYMTQRGLGKALGVTGAAISFRENGDGEHIKTLEAWAAALSCELRLVTEGSSVICQKCREQVHEECPGGTWCDCAHRPTAMLPQQVVFVGHPGAGTTTLAAKVAEEEDLREAKVRAGARLMERIRQLDPETSEEIKYRNVLQESLDLLYLEPGLKDRIERRDALNQLAQISNEAGILE